MACQHSKIRSVNCALYCLECGARLPDNWLTRGNVQREEKPAETLKKAVKRRREGTK